MSAWVTEELISVALRFCSHRSLWRQHIFPVHASIKDVSLPYQQLSHVWNTRQSGTCLTRVVSSSVRYYSEGRISNKELDTKKDVFCPPEQTQSVDPAFVQQHGIHFLRDQLAQCDSPSDVLDLTAVSTPTAQQFSDCISRMWSIMKTMSQEQCHYEQKLMFEHPSFENFLGSTMKCAHHMNNRNLVYSLLGMIKLGVPPNSRVIQTFLRVCQGKLNYFDEKSLSILASCLPQMKNTHNVQILKDSVRLLVEVRLPEIKNIVHLQFMMRLVGKDAPLNLKQKLQMKALSMADDFSVPNATHMISTLVHMDFYSKPLLKVCNQIIIENIHVIPFRSLLKLMMYWKDLSYRDFEMLTVISDHTATMIDVWSNKQVLLFLSAFESLAFCPTALMDLYTEKVIANPVALTLKDLLLILKVYSSLNYDLQHHRQQFLDSVTQALVSYLPNMPSHQLLQVVYCLCVFGHFPPPLLEHLLHSNTLEQFTITAPQLLPYQERKFQIVDLCLRLDRPPLPQPLTIPRSLLGDPKPVNLLLNCLIVEYLKKVVEDEEGWTLQETVAVENIYVIEGVITKHEPRETSVTEGEAVSPTESSQRIALMCMPHTWMYCFCTSNLRGLTAVKIRHLRILGYNPVLISEQELHHLSEEDRIKLLKERIFPGKYTSYTQPNRFDSIS